MPSVKSGWLDSSIMVHDRFKAHMTLYKPDIVSIMTFL